MAATAVAETAGAEAVMATVVEAMEAMETMEVAMVEVVRVVAERAMVEVETAGETRQMWLEPEIDQNP